MKRGIVITVLAVLAFAVIIVARMPASWVIPSPPARIACTGTDGTLWNGTCTGLVVEGQPVGDVSWSVHPAKLLTARLAAHVVLARTSHAGRSDAQADLEWGLGGRVVARNVKADFPLDPSLAPQLHLTWQGNIHTDLALVRVNGKALEELQGLIEAHDLRELGSQGADFGSYSLQFPGGAGEQTGKLHDLGGPLSVEGTVRLTNEPGIVVEGLVAARPTAPQDLQTQLRILGSPDAQGRRPFSLSEAF